MGDHASRPRGCPLSCAPAGMQAQISLVSDLCSASVPPEKAALISYWSAKCVKSPALDVIAQSLELHFNDSFGLHLKARRDFNCGEQLISEAPLILIPNRPPVSRRHHLNELGSRSAFLSPALAVEWSEVSQEQKQA